MNRIIVTVLAGLALTACQPKAKEAPPVAPPPAAAPVAAAPEAPGPASITGDVLAVEDAGYPMFTVKVKGADGVEKQLLLNAELVQLGAEPASFKGKKAQIDYVVEAKPQLLGLTFDGKSLLKDEPKREGDVKTVTGVLRGAAQPTSSDLPDQITVTDPAGAVTTFEWYVTPDMTKANGKPVTATYVNENETRITGMKNVQ